MRLPKRGEKGFTLIELLIVVAILGVLAAIVIPNVGRFIGRGKTEAAATELASVQAAVFSMMVDRGLATMTGGDMAVTGNSSQEMAKFPSNTYPLYGANISGTIVNYVASTNTTGNYTVNAQGTVTQTATGY
ncbi:MAG: prepilin-type N-terminal cleavage/methylation domain-containing protein [Chloroflexota bacterium]